MTLPYAELKSVGRALRVLETLAERQIPPKELAVELELSSGTAYRTIRFLEHSWLVREKFSGAYSVGSKLYPQRLLRRRASACPDRSGPDVLRAKIAEIAQQGYAVIQDELVVGVGSAAAPIRGTDGGVSACVSPVLRTPRLRDDAVRERALAIAMSSAEKISLGLGWRPGAGRSSPA